MNDQTHTKPEPSDSAGDVIAAAIPPPSKTPFYQAIHASRYQRQAVIRDLQERTGRRLICYVAGDAAPIDRDDTIGFVDLLHNTATNSDLDLLLHTPGGDIDAAEKLIKMVRGTVGTGVLRIVVPDFAKSAGTLMALGADIIVMSETSELGPIDPQIILADGNGNRIRHSVQSYLDAYNEHAEMLKRDPGNVVAQMMLSKLDPATVKLFESVRERAKALGESLLQQGMFREGGNSTRAVSELLNTQKWQSHGQMISWEDASHESIGLNIDHVGAESGEWQGYWQLYCMQRLAVKDRQKLFESDYASLCIDSRVHE